MLKFLQKLLLLAALCVPWATQAQISCDGNPPDTVANGTGTSITTYFPGYSFYNYSYSEVIIPASTLSNYLTNEFKGLMFNPTVTTAGTYFTNCTIYLANTTVNSLSSSFIDDPATFEMVFAGNLSYTSTGWKTVEFDNSFMWDGSSNIVVAVVRSHGSYSSGATFAAYSASGTLGRYCYRDSPGPFVIGSINNSGASSGSASTVPQYKLLGCEGEPPTCFKVRNLMAASVSVDGATLTWLDTLNSGATYTIYNMVDTSVVASNLTDTFYTITNLNSNTEYRFGVQVDCGGGDVTGYSLVSFRTSCSYIEGTMLPVTENFETYGTGTSAFPSCWNKIGSTADRPYIHATTSYGHNNTYGLYFYAAAGGYCYGVMPPVDPTLDISTLMISFWARQYSTSYNCDFVVGVMSNPTDATTFTPVGQVHPDGTTYEYFEVPLTTYTGTGTYIAFQAVQHPGSSTAIYLMLDDVTLDYTPACPTPMALNTDSVASDAINLYWIDPTNSDWLLIYGEAGFNPDTAVVNVLNLTDTSVLIGNLTANTLYEFYLAALCDDGDTTMFRTLSVRTSCEAISTLPYTENFETYGTGTTAFPTCWRKIGTTADRPYIHATTSYGHNNTYGLYFYAAASGYCYGVMPPVDPTLDITTLTVSFWARQYSTSYNCDFVVGVMTDPTDISTFTPVGQVHPDGTTYEFYEIPMTSYTGTGNNIAFQAVPHSGSSSAIYMMLDDVTLDLTPDCPSVSNLTLVASTSDSLTITWTENGSATSWSVEYGLHGFAPGTGTTDIATAVPYVITNLSASTEYDVYITPVCADDVAGTIMGSFRTDCGPIAALPYLDDFEGYETGTSSNLENGINCWARIDNASSYHFGYISSNSAANYGPHSGSKYIYYYMPTTTGTYADWNITILPQIDTILHPINTLQLSFWARMNTASVSSFIEVGVISDISDATTFVPVDTIPVAGDVYAQQTAYLNSYTGYGDRIAMKFHRGTETHYFCIDDVVIEPMPDCPGVSNISLTRMTSDSLYVTWSENGNATSWNVEYGPHGFALGSGTTEIITNLPFEVGALTPNTAYDFYITPECNSGTAATRMATFTTDCGPTPVPFTENFDSWSSTTSDPLPNCWEKHTNYSTSYPYASTSYNHGSGSGKSMYMYSTNTSYSYMVLPVFDLPIDSTMISFWLYKSNTSYAHKLQVGVMSDPSDLSTFVQVDEIVPTLSSTWEEFEVSFSSYNGTGTRIAILSPNNEYSYPYLDDLSVNRISGCQRVNDLEVPIVTLDSAIVTWSDGSNNSWFVEYDVNDFTPGTNTPHNLITVSDTFCIIGGLDSGTVYHVYVYPDCDTVVAERHTTFTTLASTPATVPYSCTFEAAGVNGWDLVQTGQNNYWMVGTATNNGGSQSLYVTDDGSANNYSGSASYSFAVRTFNLQAGNYICSYDWKCNGESSFDFIRAALVPASTNIQAGDYCGFDNASAMPVGSIALDGGYRQNLQTNWQTQVTEFTLASAAVYKLVFLWRNDGSVYNQSPAAIDNVQLMLNTCPMPDNITANNLTQTSVDFTWTEPGSATQWEYQLDNGTPIATTSNNCSITGLTANTPYVFRVRSICGDGDTSFWAVYNFRTPCGYITLPYVQDFESEATGTSTTGSAFANCMVRLNNGSSYGGYPYVSGTSTYNHTTGGTKGLYWYNTTTTGTYGDYQVVALPPVDPNTAVNTLQLSFWAKASSSSYNPVFQIGVMTDPNNVSTFVGVDTIYINGNTSWSQFELPLAAYTGTGQYVAIKSDRPTSSWYAYVDDIELYAAPTCLKVKNIRVDSSTTNSVTIDWDDYNTSPIWQIEYGPAGFTLGTGTVTTASTHPFTVTGLQPSTAYYFYVRPICGVGDTALWSAPMVGSTECSYVALPYFENFDSYIGTTYDSEGNLPVCWDAYSNGTSNSYFPHITGSGSYWYPNSNPNALTMTSGSSSYGDTKVVALPAFSQPLNTLSMTFWYRMESATNGSTLTVGYVTGSDLSATFVPVKTITSTTTITFDSVSFDTVTATSGRLAFKWYYNTSYYSCGIDDIEVTSTAASCNAPSALTANDVTYNGATLNWSSNATDFEVSWKANTEATWPTPVAVTGATSYAVTGLVPETDYQFMVRAICDATEGLISDWVIASFTTAELPCFTPTEPAATPSYTNATLNWTTIGEETAWTIHVWNSSFNEEYNATANPFTVTGLAQNNSYYAAVKAVCGDGAAESEYSDTISFTTLTCEVVTGVVATATSTTTATVTWNATGAASYIVNYGSRGFQTGDGEFITVTAASANITGLQPERNYDVYVQAVCEEGASSNWSEVAQFSTPAEIGINTADGTGLSIYPNPTTSATTIALSGVNGEVSITIVDMNGRVVMSDSMSCEGDCVKTMEVSGLAQGAYFVRISGENTNLVKKLVVK